MNNHFCSAKQVTDLLACEECGNNQICCKLCFHTKHRDEKGAVHKSCKLVDSDVYKNFLRVVHVEWLVGQKVLKSLGGFGLSQNENKLYLANTAFYGSEFYKEFFSDELSSQQYLILKCYYSNNPQSFETLSSLERILNDVKSQDIVNRYISKLTQPTEQQKVMNSHIDFYTGADIYYLTEFFNGQISVFYEYAKKIVEKEEQFSVYKYIQWRQKSQTPRNPTYYSNQYTAFVVEYYRKDLEEWTYFTLNDYILNYWEFFHTAVQVNPTLKQFIDGEVQFYRQYEKLMVENGLNITYLGFKIWKLSNGVSKELPYLKNHYFLFAFVEGYLKMKIDQTYSFSTKQQKQIQQKENWLDYVKYIKDYSILLQSQNILLNQSEKKDFDFSNYTEYFIYRKRMQPFHTRIRNSKQNIYDKDIAVKFFNEYFKNTEVQIKPKLYKEFFERQQEQKKKKQEGLMKMTEELKTELIAEEKDEFYEFIYLNFINFCQQSDIKITKTRYYDFKKQSIQTFDQGYIKLTQQKFKRGDFNVEIEQTTTQKQEKSEEAKVIISETGAKITVGIDKYEEEILEDNLDEDEDSENEREPECGCCNGDMYNCNTPDCQLMGYCTACSDDF